MEQRTARSMIGICPNSRRDQFLAFACHSAGRSFLGFAKLPKSSQKNVGRTPVGVGRYDDTVGLFDRNKLLMAQQCLAGDVAESGLEARGGVEPQFEARVEPLPPPPRNIKVSGCPRLTNGAILAWRGSAKQYNDSSRAAGTFVQKENHSSGSPRIGWTAPWSSACC